MKENLKKHLKWVFLWVSNKRRFKGAVLKQFFGVFQFPPRFKTTPYEYRNIKTHGPPACGFYASRAGYTEGKGAPVESAANVVAASSFSLQAVLGRAWETGRARPGLFFALAFVSQVPAIVANYLWVENGFGGIFWPRIFIEMGGIFCKLFFQGGLAWAASRVLRDREASFGEALGCIAARSLHLALMALLMILVVSVCLFSFILPGFIMISLWFVAIEVCVIERLGVVDSLNRSEALTHGCRMKIFGLWAMVCVAVWVANYLGAHLVLLLGAPSLLVFLAGALAASVPTAFGGVMAVVVYFELRAVGEGRSFDRLLTFFD